MLELILLQGKEEKEALPSLRATLHYLEEISDSRKDPQLVEQNHNACEKIKTIIEKIETRVQGPSLV